MKNTKVMSATQQQNGGTTSPANEANNKILKSGRGISSAESNPLTSIINSMGKEPIINNLASHSEPNSAKAA